MTDFALTTRHGAAPVWRGLLASFAGVVVGLLLATAIVTVLATQFFGFKVLTVESGSMEPSLHKGDVIVTSPVRGRDVASGDIIVYRATENLSIVHRVIGVNTVVLNLVDSKTGEKDSSTSYQFVTKGDANAAPDALTVDQRAVEGRLWFTMPIAIGGVAGLKIQWLFLALAAGLACAWVAWEVVSRRGSSQSA